MILFASLFPEIARAETRSASLFAPQRYGGFELPPDDYGFVELYCEERGCDCRRVTINVLSHRLGKHVATISHSFEPPGPEWGGIEQTLLDPINPQSSLSQGLMALFLTMLEDETYRQRLIRHYEMFKQAVDDSYHPQHPRLKEMEARWKARDRTRQKKVALPPSRLSRRRR